LYTPNQRRVVVVAPKCVHPLLAPIIRSPKLPGHLAPETAQRQAIFPIHQQMHMIRPDAAIQNPNGEFPQVLPQHRPIQVSVSGELQPQLPVVTPMR